MNKRIENALIHLREGGLVLVYDSDDRERETDMVFPSEMMTFDIIGTMRRDAGGLICTGIRSEEAMELGLPFLADVFADAAKDFPVLSGLSPHDIPYDIKSAFSLTINHRETYTGITDIDRALTVRELAMLAGSDLDPQAKKKELGKHFRAPGHTQLLRTSDKLLENRFGHTELTVALMVMAGLRPVATMCEMMGDDGKALSKEKAQAYADERGLVFLEGREIIEAWNSREW